MPRRLRLLQKAARPLGVALERIVMDVVTLAVPPRFTSRAAKQVVVELGAHRAKVRADR